MKKVSRNGRKWKTKVISKRKALADQRALHQIADLDVKLTLIQELIPLGLKAVSEQLQKEVLELAGNRYRHGKECHRWGHQGGSIYLRDQKVPIEVPRVRDKGQRKEVPLKAYQRLQRPYKGDKGLFKKLLFGLSMNRYQESAELVPEVFGISGSQVSRRFKKVTSERLRYLQSRNLSEYDFVAVFIDGKRFSEEGLIVAVGITISGEKVILGIEQMASEHHRPLVQFFNKLIERGFGYERGLLFIVDGSKGLEKAIRLIFKGHYLIQRCRWHKQENVVSYLNKGQQVYWRRQIQEAYRQADYDKAKKSLLRIQKELGQINPSAAGSLAEGLEETLTIQRLGLYNQLRRSFCTTNCIESIMSQVSHYTDRVDYWRDGAHIQRWTAAALLEQEPRLQRVAGHKHLYLLRERIQEELARQLQREEAVITQ